MFDLNLATIFSKVVEFNSLTRAAEALEIPKATVSRKISALETELGVRLLQRTTRKMNLTDSGKIYYDRCRDALNTLHQANLEASQIQEEPSGMLKITAPAEFSYEFLQKPIIEFLKLYPKINIKVEVTQRIVDLVAENYDLAFRAGKLADSTLIARSLGTTHPVMVASNSYLEKHGTPKHPSEYSRHQIIGVNSLMNQQLKFSNGNKVVNIKLKPRLSVNSFNMMCASAIAGVGLTILPSFLAIEPLRKGQLKIIMPEWKYQYGKIYLVYPSRQHIPTRTRLFMDFIMNKFDSEMPWLSSIDELEQYVHEDYKVNS